MILYLTGFMGTGKSAVGKRLARKLKYPFVDLDHEVEKTAGMKVSNIFEKRGEEHFRRLENAALRRASRRLNAVVALGGGALLDPKNRSVVMRTGTLVLLTCSRRALAKRLRPKRAHRPLLAGGSLDARIANLLRARRHAYSGAHLSIATSKLSVAATANLIARKIA